MMTQLLRIPTFFGISLEVFFILLILGYPTFLFWRWILGKFIKTEKIKKVSTWVVTIIATPLIYFALIMIWIICMSYYPSHKFTKEKWFSETEKRYELSNDIIDSNMLIGKTKEEVRQILGDEENKEESDNWIYNLGFKPGFANIDPDILEIEFRNGKVVKVEQHGT